MGKSKVAISLSSRILEKLDRLVRMKLFANRSQAIEEAVEEKLERMERSQLARECAKLDPDFETRVLEGSATRFVSAGMRNGRSARTV
jgi:Arc/MetJ-type ribon-helix-helix transcriptional regulator